MNDKKIINYIMTMSAEELDVWNIMTMSAEELNMWVLAVSESYAYLKEDDSEDLKESKSLLKQFTLSGKVN